MSAYASMDIVSALQLCRDVEACCADIYRVYAERHADDEELCALWRKMLEEEENHARQFVLAISLRREGVVADVNLDPTKARQILNLVKGIYNGILTQLPSKIDALRSAVNMERKLAEFHLDAVAVFSDKKSREMFRAMMAADYEHVNGLEAMYKKRVKG